MSSERVPSSPADTREQILSEHQQIRELVGRIEDTTDLAEIVSGLQQLQPLFESHFAREEALDGLHSDIRARAPQHRQAIDRLEQDHRELLADVAELQAQAQACLQGPIREIEALRSRFLLKLREHEARESGLFVDAIWTDLGQGD